MTVKQVARTDGSGDKVRIFPMRGIPVSSVENSDGIIILLWESFEKSNKTNFIIYLCSSKFLSGERIVSSDYLQLRP